MGMMDRFLGMGGNVAAVANAATGMAEIWRENATRRMELEEEEGRSSALNQFAAEFTMRPPNWFDGFVDGLNRLPRPLLTLGTIGLFVYAMAEPEGFGLRMANLNLVPEPLWWLLGAIISFYFGAREAHYFRVRPRIETHSGKALATTMPATSTPATSQSASGDDFADNAALRDWAGSAALAKP